MQYLDQSVQQYKVKSGNDDADETELTSFLTNVLVFMPHDNYFTALMSISSPKRYPCHHQLADSLSRNEIESASLLLAPSQAR